MADNNDQYTLSYLYLRRIVGILGIALPIVLIIGSMLFGGCTWFQDSISDYHNTNMRNIFVGLLCAISLFLFAYSGYDKLDFWMAKTVGVLGFMVAYISPTDSMITSVPFSQIKLSHHGWSLFI